MSKQINLYYKNTLVDAVGAEHGLTVDEIKKHTDEIVRISKKMADDRAAGKLPYRDLPYQTAMVESVKKMVDAHLGRFENLVVLGIGGSALGNIALQTALNSPMYNMNSDRPGPRLFVIDNVDPVQFGSIMDFLADKMDKTLINVISKSGQTAETAAQFLTIQKIFKEKMPDAKLSDYLVATTDANQGTMRGIVDREGFKSLVVPDGVGGRFSVLSDVGLFSAAMCGIDIEQLLAGARDMDARVKSDNVLENPAALYAAVQFSYYLKGKPLSVMMPYSYQLKDLCDWYRQLWAESLGKEKDLDGKTVYAGATPIKALGATDQHSQVQLYREGPNDKIFTFLEVGQFGNDVTIGDAGETAELAYLSNQNMSKLINSEKVATEYALLASNRPCLTVKFPEINAYTVGQFIYMFEVATSYMGELMNINTYDQPAVELGKIATFALMGNEKYADLAEKIAPVSKIDDSFLV